MEDNYVPFDDEYKAHLLKLPKKHLIDLFINSAKKNLSILELVDGWIETEQIDQNVIMALTELKQKIIELNTGEKT